MVEGIQAWIRVWGRRGKHRIMLNTPHADEFEELFVMLVVCYVWWREMPPCFPFGTLGGNLSSEEALHWHRMLSASKDDGIQCISRDRDYLLVPNSTNLAWSASSHRISYISLMITEASLIESLSIRSKCP